MAVARSQRVQRLRERACDVFDLQHEPQTVQREGSPATPHAPPEPPLLAPTVT